MDFYRNARIVWCLFFTPKIDSRRKSAAFQIVANADVSILAMEKPLSSYSPDQLRLLPKNVRRELRIVVAPGIGREALEEAMKGAIQQVTRADPNIDEVAVLAYDRKEDADGAYTLGRMVWAPNGVWAGMTAKIAASNDRSSYKYNADIKDRVGKVNTADKPTSEEYRLYDAMMKALNAQPDVEEDVLMPRIAKKLGVSRKRLDAIFLKVEVYKRS